MSIKFFSDIGKKDVAIAGGKGCNLGELYNKRFNVPNGFVVATKAYNDFVEAKGLKKDIFWELKDLNPGETKLLYAASKKLQKLVMGEKIDDKLVQEINVALKKLKGCKFA